VPPEPPEQITLRDGSTLAVRPIHAADKELLQRGVEAMSPDSRYKRFLSATPQLSRSQLRYLTEVDHHDHEALVAMTDAGDPVGVARFVRLAGEPDAAEVAVAVNDDWHQRGVATGMLTLLARRAREEDIARFTATALASNTAVIDLLEELGPARVATAGDGLVEMRIDLPATAEEGSMLRRALRRAAEGLLRVRAA
jgi:RimJ/RimL family protein N-acetyltransferase